MKGFWTLFISALLMTACNSMVKTLENGKQLDTQLIGVWSGSEKDQQIEGVSKSWEMNRMNDGKYTIKFSFNQDGETQKTEEGGNWWTVNGKYYEFHSYDNKTDSYSYTVLDKDRVKFKTENMSVNVENQNYEFIDTKIGESRSKSVARDGSSFQKAIKVKSVPEEYQYVKVNCPDCQMKSQSLVEEKGRFYDLLHLEKPDGKEMIYYFDVTSFYGKGF